MYKAIQKKAKRKRIMRWLAFLLSEVMLFSSVFSVFHYLMMRISAGSSVNMTQNGGYRPETESVITRNGTTLQDNILRNKRKIVYLRTFINIAKTGGMPMF